MEEGARVMRQLPVIFLSLILSVSACSQSNGYTPDVVETEPELKNSEETLNKVKVSNSNQASYCKDTDEECKLAEEAVKKFRKMHSVYPNYINLPLNNKIRFEKNFFDNVRISCSGVPEQGGVVKCQTWPKEKVKIGRSPDDFYYESADAYGEIIVGFDRDEKRALISAGDTVVEYNFTQREYDISRIDGLPPSQVSSFNEDQLKRISSSSARKKIGFSSRAKEVGLKDGFIFPLKDWRKTSPFGAQRILNGEPKKPHYGVDIAAPVGTEIYAPADGIVSLADDDLYFEGAMVLLDHGQGLISMYLHVSDIFVEEGQAVKQGEKIAAVGSRGRSTGPHLCWRMKWRNRNLDPELLTKWPGRESSANISYGSGHSDDHSHE